MINGNAVSVCKTGLAQTIKVSKENNLNVSCVLLLNLLSSILLSSLADKIDATKQKNKRPLTLKKDTVPKKMMSAIAAEKNLIGSEFICHYLAKSSVS